VRGEGEVERSAAIPGTVFDIFYARHAGKMKMRVERRKKGWRRPFPPLSLSLSLVCVGRTSQLRFANLRAQWSKFLSKYKAHIEMQYLIITFITDLVFNSV